MTISVPSFSADWQQAVDAYNRGDYQAAAEILRPLAEGGDAQSQTSLGFMYEFGRGVEESLTEAVKWYRLAAEQGHPQGQKNLGVMYEFGRGVGESLTEAVRWYRLSAEQGHAQGQSNLGHMYESGRGVEQSRTEAVKWYRLSAEQGLAEGQTRLGFMYESGRGVGESLTEAVKWYRLAAEQGYARGQKYLGVMYEFGRGVEQSLTEAVRWYRLSAEQGHAQGQSNLGHMYESGRGVEQSRTEAVKWYRLSAEQGLAEGQARLGVMYRGGRGVPQIDTEAVKWFRLSAEQGNAQAQANLGWHYQNGRALNQSDEEAIKWYRLSADQGYEWAQNQLRRMGVDWTQSQIARQNSKSKLVESITSDDSERVKALEERLAQLEAKKANQQQLISQDSLRPTLQIIGKYSDDATAFIEGRVSDNIEVAELLVNGQPIAFSTDGRFTHREYLPTGGKEFTIVTIDRAGLKSTETVRLNREAPKQVAKLSFDSLNPTTRRVKSNNNAIALIVGVADYEKTAGAEYADRDALVFYDYANFKLGIPQDRIQILINDKADEVGMLSGINTWLKRSVRQGESDVYIFFAGHGLASDDGDTAYLIPYDGAPDFLERTAISRDEVFREVSSVNPRSVTVFLDTCYSGDTRGETRLTAGRPLTIKLREQSLPKGFTVLAAAGGDQIAKPLKEARHGMFSYFLMKGMEGGADSNSDNQITARELHTYVRKNVVQQSGGSQVPELQGDGERVLVRFR